MAGDANVRSIRALSDFKMALKKFGDGAGSAVDTSARQLKQTKSHITKRCNYWQSLVSKKQQELRRAQSALQRCENSGTRDRDGRYSAPDCSRQRAQLRQVQRTLDEAAGSLARARKAQNDIEQASIEFQQIRSGVLSLAGNSTSQASSSLQGFMSQLQNYLSDSLGDYGEANTLKTLHQIGAAVAGTGLKYGNQGIDAYGLRNTPKGHSLLLVESKATANPRKKGTKAEILQLLKESNGLMQGTKPYNDSRRERAFNKGSRVAASLYSKQIHTGPDRIHQTMNYVHWTNVATGQKRLYRVYSDAVSGKVNLVEVNLPS